MLADEIRQRFVSFFQKRSHTVRPSASLIPVDPTLLLTNAGMVPFKPYFLGEEPPPFDRAVSVQKCARTVDIDIIGTTDRHLSFFEMLGNFSFGDYFKEGAITMAYEFITEDLGLDPERLWFTVYEEDEEAERIWTDVVGVPGERVQRGGRDNFWQMGVPGPCGPASELFYDRGPHHGADGGPIGGGEDRFVEFWNLVFMQNIQDEPYHVVGDLPAKNIDTGMGLERVAMVMQKADSLFLVDAIKPTLEAASELTGVSYGGPSDVSLAILADHGRTVTNLIADGVVPSNEGRGYVLRRVLRRAVRHAWLLGSRDLALPGLVAATVGALGNAYPALFERKDFIVDLVSKEEERFRKTLESGHGLLDEALEQLPAGVPVPGEVAFKLHDTYGFPIELTAEIAAEHDMSIDLETYESLMQGQKDRAREAWRGGSDAAEADSYRRVLEAVGPTEFRGYEDEFIRGKVLSLLRDGEIIDRATEGEEIEVFLDATPFYAEAGGQVGDAGLIETETGSVRIVDTQHALQGLHGHRGVVAGGFVQVGQDAEARIDGLRREGIRKSHTATHVLHATLRDIIGDHVAQAGSLVEDGRLRFDFSHFQALEADEFQAVEQKANRRVISNPVVKTTETSRDQAEEMGALAFFGDKYGEKVRVVEIGEFSLELCGGTHTATAGQVGPVVVLGESSIGSNLRRIEALTGDAAYERIAAWLRSLNASARLLKASPDEVPARLEAMLDRHRMLEAELEAASDRRRAELAEGLAAAAEKVGDHKLVASSGDHESPDLLRRLALDVRGRLGSGVVVLGTNHGGKGALVGAVTPDLVEAGVSAAQIILGGAKVLGGGGSSDPELAQAGGPNGGEIESAVEVARVAAARALSEV